MSSTFRRSLGLSLPAQGSISRAAQHAYNIKSSAGWTLCPPLRHLVIKTAFFRVFFFRRSQFEIRTREKNEISRRKWFSSIQVLVLFSRDKAFAFFLTLMFSNIYLRNKNQRDKRTTKRVDWKVWSRQNGWTRYWYSIWRVSGWIDSSIHARSFYWNRGQDLFCCVYHG